jgi:hypothetical protein
MPAAAVGGRSLRLHQYRIATLLRCGSDFVSPLHVARYGDRDVLVLPTAFVTQL